MAETMNNKKTVSGKKLITSIKEIKWNGVLAKMLAIMLLGVVGSTTTLMLIAYKHSKKSLEISVEQTLTTVSDNVANIMKGETAKIFHLLNGLASTEFIKNPGYSLEEKNRELEYSRSLDKYYVNIAYYNLNGDTINEKGQLINLRDREYLQAALGGKTFMQDPVVDAKNDTCHMFFAVPVYSNEKRVSGAIVAVVDAQKYVDVCANTTLGVAGHPFVINMKTGITVSDAKIKYVKEIQKISESETATPQMKEAVRDAMAGSVGYHVFYEPLRAKEMIACYRPVGDISNWTVFCMAPYDDYLGTSKLLLRTMILVLVLAILVSYTVCTLLVTGIIKPLKYVTSSIQTIASGNADLTQRINIKSKDEIGDVVNGFNSFSAKLQNIISNVKNTKDQLNDAGTEMKDSISYTSTSINNIISNINSVHEKISLQNTTVNQTSSAVDEVTSSINSLESMLERQGHNVSQASSAVEEMIGNIYSVNNSVDKMASSFNVLRENAENGVRKQNVVNERIKIIEEQSKMLQEANKTIANIASQTNLLAMNAAIEAAHAGESGKGFSVVASEIRKLSETSTAQSKTIGSQLSSISESISGVVAASQESSSAFKAVNDMISQTDELVSSIKIALEEQNQGSKQISEALHSMNDSSDDVRKASREMSESKDSIVSEIATLQSATNDMASSMNEMFENAKSISSTEETLKNISCTIMNSITEIGDQIDLFTV